MKRALLLPALLIASACSSVTGSNDAEIRLHNLSDMRIDSVIVQFPNDIRRYGPLQPGELSEPRSVRAAYRYARIEAWVAGQHHVLQPIDYVGERLLPSGVHTYGLTMDGSPPRLGIVMADEYRQRYGTPRSQ